MGGAYTGIADDPSATYYNPAGLMSGGRFELLGSLTSIVFVKQKVENAFRTDTISRDLDATGTTTLPHFIGTVVKFGKKAFGDHRYALAYSSFEVDRERFNVRFSEIDPSQTIDLRLSEDYRMRWWGVSFGMQAKKNVSVGISAFLANQNVGYGDDVGLAFGGTLDPNGLRTGGSSVTSSTNIGVDAWSFVFRFGALYRINPKWQIGFMFQPPGVPLKETGSIFRRFVADTQDGPSSYFLFDEGGLETNAPIPFELRSGVEYRINESTTLSIDGAVSGPVRNREVFDTPEELEAIDGRLGTYFPNTTKRRWTPNFAIGAEHRFGKVTFAGGFFTNLSAAPNLPETSTVALPEQVSTFGASLAIGVDTNGYRITMGATGYFGRGDALAFTVDREARVSGYDRTKSNSSGVLLYVAGAVSVASRGAKQVQQKYKAKRQDEESESGEDESGDADAGTGPDTGADTDADTSADTDTGAN